MYQNSKVIFEGTLSKQYPQNSLANTEPTPHLHTQFALFAGRSSVRQLFAG